VALIEKGYHVISVDSFDRGKKYVPERVEKITGVPVKNYHLNLCNLRNTRSIFTENPDVDSIIHFAAYKQVNESVEKPLKYYGNNLISLMNLLVCVREFSIPNFIFSSSSSVYGNVTAVPVNENTPATQQVSPYGRTKFFGEQMINDLGRIHPFRALHLRYFNPAGAHDSALLGEPREDQPANILPALTKTAAGQQEKFIVHGTDYPTRDGSCVRDYVHVMDIAEAHVNACDYLINEVAETSCSEIINLGTGNGVTVLEMVNAFEESTGIKLAVEYGPRRQGDAVQVYADNRKAKEMLKWQPKRSLQQMMRSAWKWEQAQAALSNQPAKK
jgi:UDP-glucose 4-epimerase